MMILSWSPGAELKSPGNAHAQDTVSVSLPGDIILGEYGIEAFHKEATERHVCIAVAEKVPSAADDKVFDSIIGKLQKKPNARGVVLFTRAEDARRILQAAKRANLSQPFHWIASDGWGKQQKLLEGLEDIAEGAITVELQSEIIEDFDRYMMQLTPSTNQRNPWFAEYWEDTFNCILAPTSDQPNSVDSNDTKDGTKAKTTCDDSFRLSEKVGYEQESKTQFVVDAVYAFAYALHNLHNDRCNTQSDQTSEQRKHQHSESVWYRKVSTDSKSQACSDMANYDGKDFYNNYLLNVSFIDLAGSEVKFDRQGDGLARYDILNYQRLENSSGYQYKVVGKWFNGLQLNSETVVWNKVAEQPTSACSLPCEVGMIKKQQGDTCCWICDSCESFEYVYDEFTCRDCGPGLWPYSDKLSCYALDIQYMRWNSLFALIPMVIAIFGITVTILVIVLFAKNHDTPLVQTTTLCISISLSASVALVCLYSPKVYILVFHPDKNVRKLTMNSTVYRRSAAAGAQGAPTSSGYSRTQAGTTVPTGGASSSVLPTQNSPNVDEVPGQKAVVNKSSEYSNGEFLAEECECVEPICNQEKN
ncbi:hypothetical protein M5D96_013135 [Drosophila gunungcola]|uniref:G-protein coupled receptors family 3 profile domain-containing protein n=1 Tax=Drosophila gunungcola TaxID=103775 RepID=A0A9Q0BJF1_9MUSC|nr:hypothetical protein M5D96_013135 [Drosophila gunungcola]